jgi:hypothetical protein
MMCAEVVGRVMDPWVEELMSMRCTVLVTVE